MYSDVLSVTGASAYFKHLIPGKHTISFSGNVPTIPNPRWGSDKKKNFRVCSLCACSEYGVQSALTFPYLQQPQSFIWTCETTWNIVFNHVAKHRGAIRRFSTVSVRAPPCLSSPWSLKTNFTPQPDNVETWKVMYINAFTSLSYREL